MVRLLPYPAFVISESSNSMIAISTASTADPPFLSIVMATLAALFCIRHCLCQITAIKLKGRINSLFTSVQMGLLVGLTVESRASVDKDGTNVPTFPRARHGVS